MKKVKEEFYFSNQTSDSFNWIQNNTGIISFEKHYCVDKNHYITHPEWDVCEICNGNIQENE